MKIPIIGEICTERWKKEAIGEIQQTSLFYATKIAKEEIDRICQDKYKQQKLKTISKDCCNILSDFKDFDIRRKTYTKKKNTNLFGRRKREDFLRENTSKNLRKKHLKRILPAHKERKNADVGSAMKKDTTLMNVQIGKKYPDKVKVLQTANNEGYEALEEEYVGIQHVFILHVDTNSSSSSEEDESTTDDSE
uniref:Uncharacterized protein n=1 Tax=Lactuca sativa TaxID=4236 RepID=A0A9R1WKC3_LACSA|nr:hypothetical protein LSAT_V11C100001590 [Lactuca sativa]